MHTLARFRPVLAASFAAALLVGVAGCGDDEEPAAGGDSGTTAPDDGSGGGDDYGSSTGGAPDAEDGTIVAVDFSLSDITVAPGAPIVLRNDGAKTHTATADGDEFDLGEVQPGDTSDPGTAPVEPGSYAFHCEIHASMTATLTVEE